MNKILGLVMSVVIGQNIYAVTPAEPQKGLLQESVEAGECGLKLYFAISSGNLASAAALLKECAKETEDVINAAKNHAAQKQDVHAIEKINDLSKNVLERHPYLTAVSTLLIGAAAGYFAPH